jgi:hypothetical protein
MARLYPSWGTVEGARGGTDHGARITGLKTRSYISNISENIKNKK